MSENTRSQGWLAVVRKFEQTYMSDFVRLRVATLLQSLTFYSLKLLQSYFVEFLRYNLHFNGFVRQCPWNWIICQKCKWSCICQSMTLLMIRVHRPVTYIRNFSLRRILQPKIVKTCKRKRTVLHKGALLWWSKTEQPFFKPSQLWTIFE